MKKTIALLLTLALMISALALPALAEEPAGTVDQITSATQQSGPDGLLSRGGHGNRRQMPGQNGQAPQMPGQNDQNGQAPQAPGQNDQNGQAPQAPGQNSQSGQAPRMPGRDGGNGRRGNRITDRNGKAVKLGKQAIFDQLLADGVISQEVYDAIIAWLQQQMPQAQQNAEASAEGTAPAEGTEPALPEGNAPAGSGEAQETLLKSLLESGAITQEQYDLLACALQTPPAPPAAPEAQSDT